MTFPGDLINGVDVPFLLAILASVLLLILWPALHFCSSGQSPYPPEPPLLPGSWPVVGHALSWFKNSSEVHQRARKWSKDLEPVSISLMGQRAYIILHPRHVAHVHRSRTLQFDSIVQWSLHTHFGMSIQSTLDIAKDPDGEGSMYANEHAFFRDILGPGGDLNSLTDIFFKLLKRAIDKNVCDVRTSGGEATVHLLDWTRDTIGRASSNAVVGPSILESNPELLVWCTRWQADFFKFSFGLPRWLARDAYANRDKILDAFARHTKDEEAMWFVRKREELMEARGLGKRDMGGLTFAFWTGLQANATPTSFWLLHFISHNSHTVPTLLAEIAPAFSSAGELVSLPHLLHHTPLLTSMFHETLRVTSGVVSMRKVVEDTVIGGWKLKRGAMVMLPGRPAHFDEDVWGPTASTFVPDRFVHSPEYAAKIACGSALDREGGGPKRTKAPGIKAVKPFGGGNTLCPGRFFASNEVLAYVATVLWWFDLVPIDGATVAEIDTATPTVGTYLPRGEVRVRLRLREERR